MKRFNQTLASALVSWVIMAQTASALITIDTVPVGNAGNANHAGYGAVGYDYGIGKYEVTLNQYSAFLNAVGATDTYGLYNTQMGSNPNIIGISRSGASGSYTYSVIGNGNRPVTYVNWYDAARFANWLHNGQPTGAQTAGTTETGAYTMNGPANITRNANWTYGLPSENEWYKAAYYDQSLNSGSGGYWLYPTRSNTEPNSRNGSVIDPNSGNFYRDDSIANGFNGGYAVNNSMNLPAGNALTDVGAFSLASSFYGTFDQGGNVLEWYDENTGLAGLRGGSWRGSGSSLRGDLGGFNTLDHGVGYENPDIGFRIVAVPEPSVGGIIALGIVVLVRKLKRSA